VLLKIKIVVIPTSIAMALSWMLFTPRYD
jgi:hypothetical protein